MNCLPQGCCISVRAIAFCSTIHFHSLYILYFCNSNISKSPYFKFYASSKKSHLKNGNCKYPHTHMWKYLWRLYVCYEKTPLFLRISWILFELLKWWSVNSKIHNSSANEAYAEYRLLIKGRYFAMTFSNLSFDKCMKSLNYYCL